MTEGPAIRIFSDDRERDSGIPQILQTQFHVCVVEARMTWGDYRIDERIVVERKTIHDFALSVIDGRLFRQVQRMKRHAEEALMILEGNPAIPMTVDLHPHAFKGAILSIVFDWNVPVLFSNDAADTALTLWLIAQQWKQRQSEVSLRPGRRPKRLRNRQIYVLQGLPFVGSIVAMRLLEHFGSVERVIGASAEQLMEVNGVGRKTASKIKEVVSTSG